jgi:hypothetical protein
MPETDLPSKRNEFAKLLFAMFALPLPFEAAIAFVKREPYDPRRAAILLGTIGVMLIFGLLMRQRAKDWYVQSIIGYYAILIGFVLAAAGLAAVFAEDNLSSLIWPDGTASILTALASTLGFLLIGAGLYLVRERRRRAEAEIDMKVPRDISAVRIVEHNKLAVALWQETADHETTVMRQPIIELARNALAVEDLHYLAMFDENAECQFYVDLFDDPKVASFARGPKAARRETYIRLGHYLRFITKHHDIAYPGLHTGSLVRMVYDVEQGAAYYYGLSTEGFLVGVTLNQTRVDPTDWKLSELANAIRVQLGMTEAEDFYRLCPKCNKSNRGRHPDHTPGEGGGSNVHELRPRDAS